MALDSLRTQRASSLAASLGADYGGGAAGAIVARLVRERRLLPVEIGGRSYVVTAGDHGRHLDIVAAVARRRAAWSATVDEALLAESLAEARLSPDPGQMAAIRVAIESPVSVVHGRAGTGKSTVAIGISTYLGRVEAGRRIVTAFSARIAEKSGSRCGLAHETCHALTGTRPNEEWSEGEPMDDDIATIFVDEAFSVGPGILSRILRLAPERCRVVFLGDPNQLPPIEGGRPLHDLLEVGAMPSAELTTAHRLRGSNHLLEQVERVNTGRRPLRGENLAVVTCQAPGRLGDAQKAAVAAREHARATSMGRTCVVLTPTRHGPAGHEAISARITGRVSPGVGDAVITVQGHPDGLWRNGESASVVSVGDVTALLFEGGRHVPVHLPDRRVAFACAMSAHRAQGLEYDEVVVVLARSTSANASRQLLGSAMTRAPRCTIVTDEGVLDEVCARDEVADRPAIISAIAKGA